MPFPTEYEKGPSRFRGTDEDNAAGLDEIKQESQIREQQQDGTGPRLLDGSDEGHAQCALMMWERQEWPRDLQLNCPSHKYQNGLALSCLCHGHSYHVILFVPEALAEEIRVKLFLINVLS